VYAKTTVWIVPDRGVIKVVGSCRDGGTVYGEGSDSESNSFTLELT
jgi:hypothetical protein